MAAMLIDGLSQIQNKSTEWSTPRLEYFGPYITSPVAVLDVIAMEFEESDSDAQDWDAVAAALLPCTADFACSAIEMVKVDD
jgi:hypothetical protein